ncbi:ArsA-related P-loop ATPase [Laribacter hongkongensis]|nr:ArsA-related P-loop ATPase [Laribacter hongkongensis]
MSKSGVGKTTVAAAIAVNLARNGHKVVLSTTDPAAHVASTLDGRIDGLTVTRIDPAAEVAQYTAEVLGKTASQLDSSGLAMLEEDLRSPCTEEIAVFRAFARTVAEGKFSWASWADCRFDVPGRLAGGGGTPVGFRPASGAEMSGRWTGARGVAMVHRQQAGRQSPAMCVSLSGA